MTRPLHLVWLVVLWTALWGSPSPANLASGVVVALGVGVVSRRIERAGRIVVRPVRALMFTLYFVYKLIQATAVVVLEVATKHNRIRTGIIAVPLPGCTDALVTLVADAISLTPGTLTVEVRRDPPTLYVHVLHLLDVDKVRRNIRQLVVLAVRAFGDDEALASLDRAHADARQVSS